MGQARRMMFRVVPIEYRGDVGVVVEGAGINLMSINSDGTLSHFNNISVPAPVALAIYPSHP
jgi:hypothetical protein